MACAALRLCTLGFRLPQAGASEDDTSDLQTIRGSLLMRVLLMLQFSAMLRLALFHYRGITASDAQGGLQFLLGWAR